ncbi:integrase [Xenorhabdus ishibashii]|uniref:Integrase n=1 Tax=Xenorhabdus ishibashii TaxID=1034471 RepID=A0A2D0KED7_9GAMM|nr:integrase [Xenorhabdus ishibashii]
MLHTNNPIIKYKAGLLNLAEEPGNVSRACKVNRIKRLNRKNTRLFKIT